MQTDVRDIRVLQKTVSFLVQNKNEINDTVNITLQNLNKKKEEVNTELNISQNMLNIAKVNEIQKQAILAQKQIQLTQALQQQASALATGFPPAIAIASAFVARATYECTLATNEYQKSRQNRINMERKVELVKKALYHTDKLKEESRIQFNSQLTLIGSFVETAQIRLNKASFHLDDYLSSHINSIENTIDNGLINIEKYFKTIGITDLEHELLDDAQIDKSHGKIVAKRDNTFSISYTDALGRTNKQRMEDGLAPIGIDGKSIELHHLKQKDNGVMIELTSDEHNTNSKVLHRYETQSQINRGDFIKWKKKYWKDRAKEF